jgi:hypothetical protein
VNPAAKLGGFAVVLALVFGGATLAGRAIDPFGDEPTSHMPAEHSENPDHGSTTSVPGTTHPAEHTAHTEGEP